MKNLTWFGNEIIDMTKPELEKMYEMIKNNEVILPRSI